ncbi:aspartate/glutamate racemase family protein [Mycobacterium sp. NPDC003449]
MTTPRIALVSAVPAAIPPAAQAFAAEFPAADVWNILDDRLLNDANARGGLDEGLIARMQRLIAHAVDERADAVLLTCSLYGPVAQQVARTAPIPVLAPDESAFAQIAREGYPRVLVVSSFAAAAEDSTRRLGTELARAGVATTLDSVVVSEAKAATEAGDQDGLERALIDRLTPLAPEFDAVFLSQYSLAPAGRVLAAALGLPVVSGPESAARRLAGLLSATAGPVEPS